VLVANHAQYAARRVIKAADRNGKRFVVRADEKLTLFLELEAGIRARPAVGWQRVVRQWRELQSTWN
jgi:hypothetical protein